MISHCANPECRAPLRYLRGGRLYRFDVKSPAEPCHDVPNVVCAGKPRQTTVFFWLCEQCCSRFTLDFDIRNGMKLVPHAKTKSIAASAPSLVSAGAA